MSESDSSRTRAVDGQKLTELRLAKGLSVEDLAEKSKVSEKTIRSMQKGARCYINTVRVVAAALGVQCATLLTGDPPAPPHSSDRIRVVIHLPRNLKEFDQADELRQILESLQTLLGGDLEMDVQDIESGSIIVTFEMNESGVFSLYSAILDGSIKALGIQRVSYSHNLNDYKQIAWADWPDYLKQSYANSNTPHSMEYYLDSQLEKLLEGYASLSERHPQLRLCIDLCEIAVAHSDAKRLADIMAYTVLALEDGGMKEESRNLEQGCLAVFNEENDRQGAEKFQTILHFHRTRWAADDAAYLRAGTRLENSPRP